MKQQKRLMILNFKNMKTTILIIFLSLSSFLSAQNSCWKFNTLESVKTKKQEWVDNTSQICSYKDKTVITINSVEVDLWFISERIEYFEKTTKVVIITYEDSLGEIVKLSFVEDWQAVLLESEEFEFWMLKI